MYLRKGVFTEDRSYLVVPRIVKFENPCWMEFWLVTLPIYLSPGFNNAIWSQSPLFLHVNLCHFSQWHEQTAVCLLNTCECYKRAQHNCYICYLTTITYLSRSSHWHHLIIKTKNDGFPIFFPNCQKWFIYAICVTKCLSLLVTLFIKKSSIFEVNHDHDLIISFVILM